MIAFFLFLLSLTCIQAFPQGASTKVCQTMKPFHGGGIPTQDNTSPYSIYMKRQNNGVLVTLKSDINIPFQGFMLQARTSTGLLLGVFKPKGNAAHTIDCAQPKDTLTHSNPDNKDFIEVEWQPPEDYQGPVFFNSTFAQNYQTFWVGVESQPIQVGKNFADDLIPNVSTRSKSTTIPKFFPENLKQSKTAFDSFYEGCGMRKLCFGAPAGCIESKNCTAATAVITCCGKYEFEMIANLNPKWVGVGLSDDTRMGEDSVIECVKDENRSVKAYMAWTSGPWSKVPGNYGSRRLTNPQLGIRLMSSSVIDDVLYCRVLRDVRTNVNGRYFDLSNETYHLLVAAGPEVTSSSVGFHYFAYLASNNKLLLDVSALPPPVVSKLFMQLHASFMLAAWVGTVSIGTLLARYYRKTWVGSSLGGKDIWFAWHIIFMVLSLVLTMVAFILIFVELRAWSALKNPHAILGTVTTILCFLQPIGAYFRPHPGTPRRPIFNRMHWFVGNASHIIGIATIFYPFKFINTEFGFMDWMLTAYVAFHIIVHLILSIMGSISEKSLEKRVTALPMEDLGGSGRSFACEDRNVDAPYSRFRKVILAIYIAVILVIVVTLIISTVLKYEIFVIFGITVESSK